MMLIVFNAHLLSDEQRKNGSIAQLVEQRIENPRVDSSILSRATIY